jgi:superfamily II DNA or RNA helicase
MFLESLSNLSKVENMDKIQINKKDEVYAKISCEKHVAKEISEYFTFFVPGYQFTPAFRNRIWDGKIRLFNLQTNQLYLGLIPYLEIFCKEREYEVVHIEPYANVDDDYPVYHAKKFIEELKVQSRGKNIEVRDYQIEAFITGMRKHRQLLLSPTASGKSLIIYMFVRQLLQYQNLRGLIIVPTTSLVEQLYSDFEDYSTANGWKTEDHVHRVYQGKDKNSNKDVIISTWQSLYNLPKEYFHQFDFVIGDEAHLFKAQSLTTIMTNLINTKYRIGLTGTLDGTKTHKLVLEGLFGAVKKVVSTKELIDKGQLSQFEIKCLVLKHDDDICKLMKKSKYPEELEYLIFCEARNKFIKNLSLSLEGNSLILYQFVDKHGQILYDMIRNAEKIGNRKVFFIHGKVDTDAREQIRKIMETENDAIVVASYGTFSTGINIRNLHNIVFASPSKSRVRNLQSIGRGLRQSDTKDRAVLYDISDDLRHGDHTNFTLKHFLERVKIYNEEKFSYKIYKIGLKR